jgi:hypothetical protein
MLQVGFEPTIPAIERAKTVHSLGRAAAVIGISLAQMFEILNHRTIYDGRYLVYVFVWLCYYAINSYTIQSAPVGKVHILGGHSIGHSKEKMRISTCVLFLTVSGAELLHCTDEQHSIHVLTRVAKCIDVDGGIFENVLY